MRHKVLAILIAVTVPIWILPMAICMIYQIVYFDALEYLDKKSKKDFNSMADEFLVKHGEDKDENRR